MALGHLLHDSLSPLNGGQRQQPTTIPGGRGRRPLPAQHGGDPFGDVGVVIEAEDRRQFWELGCELWAIALGQAANGDDRLPGGVLGAEQGVNAFLARRLDEGAGVDQDDVGALGFGDLVAGPDQTPGQSLGVHVIAGAAQGDKGDPNRHRAAGTVLS